MAENSKIEWTDHTVNLWWGCTKVHTGCKNCYAEYLSDTRYKNGLWGENNGRKRIMSAFSDLEKYQKEASRLGVNHKIFLGSMMDIFEDSKLLNNPIGEFKTTEDLRSELFKRISREKYENLIFLFLTKRLDNIFDMIPKEWYQNTPKNIWFGTSISNEKTEIYAIKLIIGAPENSNLFLSVEPQVGEVSLSRIDKKLFGATGDDYDIQPLIKWIIQGGESGHNKRPFNIDWAYSLKAQCKDDKVPYFFKQIDKIQPIPEDLMIREFPKEMI